LEKILDDVSYSCGASFEDLDLPENLKSVCVKYHECNEPVEKLYFSSGYSPICIYCCSVESLSHTSIDSEFYPQCESCNNII
jgi:hypothetical protein